MKIRKLISKKNLSILKKYTTIKRENYEYAINLKNKDSNLEIIQKDTTTNEIWKRELTFSDLSEIQGVTLRKLYEALMKEICTDSIRIIDKHPNKIFEFLLCGDKSYNMSIL